MGIASSDGRVVGREIIVEETSGYAAPTLARTGLTAPDARIKKESATRA